MIFCRSNAASRRSCNARIALACTSSMSSNSINPVRAMSTVADARMSAITASSWSSALRYPRKMWISASALRSRYAVRLTITSIWWSTQWRMKASSGSVRGTSSTSASMLAPKVVCSCVCL
ncbi:MAG: hypothetical protein BWY91_02320 [bacterium ADurb.BinA028]|nr:MAG: hypothetical protein BWY91_02320 [bacterium ADurb.BinA028]